MGKKSGGLVQCSLEFATPLSGPIKSLEIATLVAKVFSSEPPEAQDAELGVWLIHFPQEELDELLEDGYFYRTLAFDRFVVELSAEMP